MKIVTKRPAEEMAIAAPDEADLAMMKEIFPHPENFPMLTPEELKDNYNKYASEHPEEWRKTSEKTDQYITGQKAKGRGIAIASYPRLYENAIKPLQDMWEIRDNAQAVVDYLWEHPILYKKDKNPIDVRNNTPEGETPNIALYVAHCFTNLMEWMYLSSIPVHQYIREQLLEKARYLRKKYSQSTFARGYVTVLPQRPTTSRSLGENETALHQVNAGYRVVTSENPFTQVKEAMLELLTWFYTDSQTKKRVFKDYFDVENGNMMKALRTMRRSDIYRAWAQRLSPKNYAASCSAYEITENLDEELKGLTPIMQDPEEKN